MKKYILFIVCIFCFRIMSSGQELTNYERRRMNDKLLELVLSYENYSQFSEQYMQYAFADLFVDKNAGVYCDYIASPHYGKIISLTDYARYSTDSVHVRFVELRNLKKSDYRLQSGKHRVTVEFDKCLDYEDEIYTYFATEDDAIGGDFHITMECEYDKEEEKFSILSVKGTSDSLRTFPSGQFIVVERRNDRDTLIKVNKKPIRFNKFNEAYVPGDTPPVFADEDVVTVTSIVGTTARYKKVNYSYKETRCRLRVGVSFAPMSAYRLDSHISFGFIKSSAYEASVDFGYALPWGMTSKLAIYMGLGVAYSSLDLGVSDINYQYELSDASSTYERKYQISDVREGLRFTDVMVPLYVSYEQSFGTRLAMSMDAGVKLYLNTDTKVNPYVVNGQVSIISDNISQNPAPLPSVVSQYMSPVSYMRNTYDVAAFAKVGLEYKIKHGNYVYLKAGYLYGITESYKSNMNIWFDASEGIYPFVYSGKSDSDVAVRSFADCISYRRSALTFDLGYRMKF